MSQPEPHSASSSGPSPHHYPDFRDDQNLEAPDEVDTALNPLERLQRKWGIGDRKTRDGQPAKRRGPKPDSKPALTRRQELNRQAQRTHRERKESYMRELEVSVDHLRRVVHQVGRENEKLKELLQAHGIPYDVESPDSQPYTSPGSISMGGTSPTYSGQASTNFNSMSPPNHSTSMQISPSFNGQQTVTKPLQAPPNNIHGIDYDEMGLGFVAEYERTPYLSPPPN